MNKQGDTILDRLSPEELEARLRAKINAIPKPQLSIKQNEELLSKNRIQDKNNLDKTMQILNDRRKEAEVSGDQKKKFHTLAIEHNEKDQFNVREKLWEKETEFKAARAAFQDEDWEILTQFWESGRENGYNDSDIALYYKEMGVEPRVIIKFIEVLKMQQELDRLHAMYLTN